MYEQCTVCDSNEYNIDDGSVRECFTCDESDNAGLSVKCVHVTCSTVEMVF